jgi:ribonuclease HII
MRWGHVERELRSAGGLLLAGVDEVGRGPLAGPVVACAIVMRPDAPTINGVADSKTVSAADRRDLALKIVERALSVGIGAASVHEIDRLNIYHASTLAIRRAIGRLHARLRVAPAHVLIDGNPIRALGLEHRGIVGGDATCYSIACASIIAKVTRDRLMYSLARRYPAYLWERNVGYSTSAHLSALTSAGPTVHHRKSFGPVAQCQTHQEVHHEIHQRIQQLQVQPQIL